MLATFLSQVVNGLILGSLIGLIALGYTMVYGIIQLINFAHGEVFMVGAYGGLFMFTYLLPTFVQQQWYLALPLLLIGGAAVSTVVAVLMERFAYRPLRGAPRLAPLITALGVSVVLQELVRNFYPGATAALPFPRVFVQGTWEIPVRGGTVPLRWTGLLIIVLSLVLASCVDDVRQRHADGARDAGGVAGPRHRAADGRRHRPRHRADVRARRGARRCRRDHVRHRPRLHQHRHRLPERHLRLHRGGARRDRQPQGRASSAVS